MVLKLPVEGVVHAGATAGEVAGEAGAALGGASESAGAAEGGTATATRIAGGAGETQTTSGGPRNLNISFPSQQKRDDDNNNNGSMDSRYATGLSVAEARSRKSCTD